MTMTCRVASMFFGSVSSSTAVRRNGSKSGMSPGVIWSSRLKKRALSSPTCWNGMNQVADRLHLVRPGESLGGHVGDHHAIVVAQENAEVPLVRGQGGRGERVDADFRPAQRVDQVLVGGLFAGPLFEDEDAALAAGDD